MAFLSLEGSPGQRERSSDSPSIPSTAETWMLFPDGRTVSRNDCGAGFEVVGRGKQATMRANKGEGRSFGQIIWAPQMARLATRPDCYL